MAVPWPSQLQQNLLEPSFNFKYGDSRLRTNMDVGLAKVRRRSTREIDTASGSIHLKYADYMTFKNFYKTSINGGVTPFDIIHPIEQVTATFRFVSAPTIRSIGGGVFEVSMEWEEMP